MNMDGKAIFLVLVFLLINIYFIGYFIWEGGINAVIAAVYVVNFIFLIDTLNNDTPNQN